MSWPGRCRRGRQLYKVVPKPSEKRRTFTPQATATRASASLYLDSQLDSLRRMYADMKGANYRDNFTYIAARSLHVMAGRRTSDFGDTRLFKPAELQRALHDRGR